MAINKIYLMFFCCKCTSNDDKLIPLWLIILLIAVGIIFLLFFGKKLIRKLQSAFPNESKITVKTGLVDFDFPIKRSYENIHIANRIYIELVTRKAALP